MYTIGQHLGFLVLGYLANALGHSAVCQQHEFLNQLVGILCHLEICAQRTAFLINDKTDFATVKIDSPVFEAATAEFLGHAIKHNQFGGVFLCRRRTFVSGFCRSVSRSVIVLGAGFLMVLQYLLHLFVGETTVAPCYGVCQLPALHFRLFVETENHAVGEFVLIGAQRANEITKPFGQHGNGAVYQIDAGGALERFTVYNAVFLHIMAHIGNVNAHFPQVFFKFADADGIVEVLGIARINCNGEHIAHVQSSVHLLLRDFCGNLLGGLLHLFGIDIGQSVFGQNGVHLGSVLSCASQDVNDLSDGILGILGPFDNLDHGLVSGLPLLQVRFGDEDVVGQGAVFRKQIGILLADLKCSHKSLVRAFQNFGYLCLSDMVSPTGQKRGLDKISVHGMQTVALCHQDGLSPFNGFQRVLSVGFPSEGSLHNLGGSVQHIDIALGLLHIIVQHKLFQYIQTEHLGRMGGQMQQTVYSLQFQRLRRVVLEQLNQHSCKFRFSDSPASSLLLSHNNFLNVFNGFYAKIAIFSHIDTNSVKKKTYLCPYNHINVIQA